MRGYFHGAWFFKIALVIVVLTAILQIVACALKNWLKVTDGLRTTAIVYGLWQQCYELSPTTSLVGTCENTDEASAKAGNYWERWQGARATIILSILVLFVIFFIITIYLCARSYSRMTLTLLNTTLVLTLVVAILTATCLALFYDDRALPTSVGSTHSFETCFILMIMSIALIVLIFILSCFERQRFKNALRRTHRERHHERDHHHGDRSRHGGDRRRPHDPQDYQLDRKEKLDKVIELFKGRNREGGYY